MKGNLEVADNGVSSTNRRRLKVTLAQGTFSFFIFHTHSQSSL